MTELTNFEEELNHDDIPYRPNNVRGEMENFYTLANNILDKYGLRKEINNAAVEVTNWERKDLQQKYELLRTVDESFLKTQTKYKTKHVQLLITQTYPDGQQSITAEIYSVYENQIQKARQYVQLTEEQRLAEKEKWAAVPQPEKGFKIIVDFETEVEHELNYLVGVLEDGERRLSDMSAI